MLIITPVCHGSVSGCVLCFNFHALSCPFSVLCNIPCFPFLLVACLSPSVCKDCFPIIFSSMLLLRYLTCCSTSLVPRLVVSVCVYIDAPREVSSHVSFRVSSLPFGMFWILFSLLHFDLNLLFFKPWLWEATNLLDTQSVKILEPPSASNGLVCSAAPAFSKSAKSICLSSSSSSSP